MKRKGYASVEMKKMVKEIKKQGVNQFMLTAYVGAYQKTVFRKTANGISAWANEVMAKYDRAVVVVEYMDKNFQFRTLCEYC